MQSKSFNMLFACPKSLLGRLDPCGGRHGAGSVLVSPAFLRVLRGVTCPRHGTASQTFL